MEPLSSRWNSILTATILFSLVATSSQRTAASEVQPFDIRPPVSLVGAERLYWIGTGASAEDAMALREALIAAGARNVNLFVPDMIIVCEAPRDLIDEVKQVSSSTTFRMRSARDLRINTASDESWGWITESYALAERVARGEGAAALAPGADGDPGFRDVVTTLSPERVEEVQRNINERRRREMSAPRPEITRTIFQNSEILSGGILANFVYPESSGQTEPNTENWSEEDLRQARAGATAAFLSWQGKFPNMDISYIIHHFEQVECAYEPITHDLTNDNLWIVNVMHQLGYGLDTKDPFEVTHEFNETERVNWHTQWVVTSFIASSRNIPRHLFDSGEASYVAYANLGGPYMVEPFPAGLDPNEIGETLVYSQIVQHEIGHQFWTLDEYRGAGVCNARSGYMDVANGNVTMIDPDGNNARCYPEVPCLMHSASRSDLGRPWCDFSEGHLGVFDGNGNGVPDIFEAEPVITFFPEGAETVTTNTYTIRFRANSSAVKNSNPFQRPDQRVSYALPLSGGRLFFGAVQLPLEALDGSWNEIEEDAEFRMAVPQAGQLMQITAQVTNKAGFQSKRISKLVYFAGVRYDRLIALPKWNRIELTWQTMGETFGAKFNVYRLKNGETKPGILLASDVAPFGTGGGGQPMYRVHDFDIKPGERYRYYVEGVFDLPYENGTREYRSQSQVVGQTAMVTMTGDMVSNVAPNPTRGGVVFSVSVPKTFQNTERGQSRVPTDVDISVYNVRGQLTRALKRSSEMEPVLTMQWDGTYQDGKQAPSGIYFLRVKAGDTETVRKIVLLR